MISLILKSKLNH